MFELKDITVVIPTNLKNIRNWRITQLNNYAIENITVILSIPPKVNIEDTYKLGFSKNINIINSQYIGQVNQRQYGLNFCETNLIIQMDDDIDFPINKIKNLLIEFKKLPKHSCLAPYLEIEFDNNLFFKISNLLKNIFLYSEINPKSGSVSRSSFPIPHLKRIKNEVCFEEVSWLPGGILILSFEDIISENYFPFKGKAYCEDLIHSFLLKKKGIKLFLSNQISFNTEIISYRSLNLRSFRQLIFNDFKIRNYYRKLIKNNFISFIVAYIYIIVIYLTSRIKRIIFKYLKIS